MELPAVGAEWPPRRDENKKLLRSWRLYASRDGAASLNSDPTSEASLASQSPLADPKFRRVYSGIVSDISSMTAGLMIGDGVKVSVDVTDEISQVQAKATEDRCHHYLASGANAVFVQSSEIGSGINGPFIRLVANPDLRDEPYITTVDPLRALPVFVDNQLVACITWTEIHKEGNKVIRFVESRDNRTRKILSAVYEGTVDNLGDKVSLDDYDQTVGIEPEVDYPDEVKKMVFFLPNRFPDKDNPQNPTGSNDFQGSESLIEALNQAYTSLLREVHLGKARLLVPTGMLKKNSTNPADKAGSSFDFDRELYTDLNLPIDGSVQLQLVQGAIRSQEHLAIINQCTEKIIQNAGYSPHSFGLGEYGVATSGTALKIREGRTFSTIAAKRQLWEPVLRDIFYNLLALDRAVFGVKVIGPNVVLTKPNIVWAPIRSDDPLERANVLNTLQAANVMSIETGVRALHPEWDQATVDAEVERIGSDVDRLTSTLNAAAAAQTPNTPNGEATGSNGDLNPNQ